MDPVTFWPGRLLDVGKARAALDESATIAEADVAVAMFGIPDTGKPVGVPSRQIIDHGAFRSLIEDRDFNTSPVPYYIDHGHAHVTGFLDQRLKIGKGDNFREEENELVFRGHYNLGKQVAREAVSDMVFDPANSPHSFSWDRDETYKGNDGFVHARTIFDMREASLVGRGAQMNTGVRPETIMVRSLDELAKWVKDDPDFAEQARALLTDTANYVPDGNQASAMARSTSIGRIQELVYRAFREGLGEDYSSTVEDCLIDNLEGTSGKLVVQKADGSIHQYSWSRNADGEVTIDTASDIPVESEWVAVRSELILALSLRGEDFIKLLDADPKMRAVIETSLEHVTMPEMVHRWYEETWRERAKV